MMQLVSGQKDPTMILLRELLTEDGRKSRGMFFAEGIELTMRAFDYGARVQSVVMTEKFASTDAAQNILRRADDAGAPVHGATEGLLAKVLEAKPTPECLAIVDRRTCSVEEALSGNCPLVVMVEHGENADNLGMLLRSCDAAGVTGVVLAAGSTDPFARRVVRGSRGSVFTLPICIAGDPVGVIELARESGIRVIASSAQSDTHYTQVDYRTATMIAVGNEHVGISDGVRQHADEVVRIPMFGRINSLNIAVAASVIAYEASRQRTESAQT